MLPGLSNYYNVDMGTLRKSDTWLGESRGGTVEMFPKPLVGGL
jgi:hypothetical protein